jgi:hypothetical protein
MIDEQKVFERVMRGFVPPDDSLERLLRRRDRKRRNQRIAAGVVGLGVFVAAVWIVGDVASLNRIQETVVPGGSGTSGPAETGPAQTGPAQTGSAIRGPYEYDPTADYKGLPPEDAEPSGRETSELVAEAHEIHVGNVYVFEDGLVVINSEDGLGYMPGGFIEQRLSPKGVELVRSGVIQAYDFICFKKLRVPNNLAIGCQGPLHKIPPSAWEDSTLRPYVPYRYAICGIEDLQMLPVPAQDLLRGKEATFDVLWARQGAECFDVTTEEARTLDAILADAGFVSEGNGRWNSLDSELVEVGYEPILPHGTFGSERGG